MITSLPSFYNNMTKINAHLFPLVELDGARYPNARLVRIWTGFKGKYPMKFYRDKSKNIITFEKFEEHFKGKPFGHYPGNAGLIVFDVDSYTNKSVTCNKDNKWNDGPLTQIYQSQALDIVEQEFGLCKFHYTTQSGGLHVYYDCEDINPFFYKKHTIESDKGTVSGELISRGVVKVHEGFDSFRQHVQGRRNGYTLPHFSYINSDAINAITKAAPKVNKEIQIKTSIEEIVKETTDYADIFSSAIPFLDMLPEGDDRYKEPHSNRWRKAINDNLARDPSRLILYVTNNIDSDRDNISRGKWLRISALLYEIAGYNTEDVINMLTNWSSKSENEKDLDGPNQLVSALNVYTVYNAKRSVAVPERAYRLLYKLLEAEEFEHTVILSKLNNIFHDIKKGHTVEEFVQTCLIGHKHIAKKVYGKAAFYLKELCTNRHLALRTDQAYSAYSKFMDGREDEMQSKKMFRYQLEKLIGKADSMGTSRRNYYMGVVCLNSEQGDQRYGFCKRLLDKLTKILTSSVATIADSCGHSTHNDHIFVELGVTGDTIQESTRYLIDRFSYNEIVDSLNKICENCAKTWQHLYQTTFIRV